MFRDQANTTAYSVLTNYYGASGALGSQTGTWDNGDSWSELFTNGVMKSFTYTDTGVNDHIWSTYNYLYDDLGRVTSETGNNDDGTRSVITYDPGNEAAYSVFTTYYGVNGLRTGEVGTFDNADVWSSAFNASGVLTSKTITDAGVNDHPWTSHLLTFNAAGATLSDTYFNDDSTRAADVKAQPWASREVDTDAQGRVTQEILVNDAGSKQVTNWDVTGSKPFDYFVASYVASGQLGQEIVHNRDGTTTTSVWDWNNVRTWSLEQTVANASGALITTTDLNRDGSASILFGAAALGQYLVTQHDGRFELVHTGTAAAIAAAAAAAQRQAA